MRFFFPDSQDMVDPSFDFEKETRAEFRVRQHDDRYAHEVFEEPPFDGILVSMAIVEGMGSGSSGRYTMPQRHRLKRVGVKEFFRLANRPATEKLVTLGDCGAFSYVNEEEPPFPTEQVVTFYEDCQFDLGISVDHVILGFKPEYDHGLPGVDLVPADWRRRQAITLERAKEFLHLCSRRRSRFEPVGVAQGWSPASYASAFQSVQDLGFQTIALGGMVPLKTKEILSVLEAVDAVRRPGIGVHLLGISRCEHVADFARLGMTSFDSTSPLRQAFKDDKDNYYDYTSKDRTYPALRIPQVDANPSLARAISAGKVNQAEAIRLERACLEVMKAFDAGGASLEAALSVLLEYERLYDGKRSREVQYRQVLEALPWKRCPCAICRQLGYNVILFRGAERNRRRGFHNLFVFNQRLHAGLEEMANASRRARRGAGKRRAS